MKSHEDVIVNGIKFIHENVDEREYYEYVDKNNWAWVLQRYHTGPDFNWNAYVLETDIYGTIMTLNSISTEQDRITCGPMYFVPNNIDDLLEALTMLITKGDWPQELVFIREE